MFFGKRSDGKVCDYNQLSLVNKYICRGLNKPCCCDLEQDVCYVPHIINGCVEWVEVDCDDIPNIFNPEEPVNYPCGVSPGNPLTLTMTGSFTNWCAKKFTNNQQTGDVVTVPAITDNTGTQYNGLPLVFNQDFNNGGYTRWANNFPNDGIFNNKRSLPFNRAEIERLKEPIPTGQTVHWIAWTGGNSNYFNSSGANSSHPFFVFAKIGENPFGTYTAEAFVNDPVLWSLFTGGPRVQSSCGRRIQPFGSIDDTQQNKDQIVDALKDINVVVT